MTYEKIQNLIETIDDGRQLDWLIIDENFDNFGDNPESTEFAIFDPSEGKNHFFSLEDSEAKIASLLKYVADGMMAVS